MRVILDSKQDTTIYTPRIIEIKKGKNILNITNEQLGVILQEIEQRKLNIYQVVENAKSKGKNRNIKK